MAEPEPEGFEAHLGELERIVEDLESGDLTLDRSMKRYEEGVKRLRACYQLLQKAEGQIKILVRGADGELAEEPLPGEDA